MTKTKPSSPRSSGILLHPTSLPGPYGIGDLGPAAHGFADFLAASGQHLWQVLPLGPTGYGDSPYQLFSAFAGNPLLISPERLHADGLLDTLDPPSFPPDEVDYGAVIGWNEGRSEEHTSELQSHSDLVCRLLLEKKKTEGN